MHLLLIKLMKLSRDHNVISQQGKEMRRGVEALRMGQVLHIIYLQRLGKHLIINTPKTCQIKGMSGRMTDET